MLKIINALLLLIFFTACSAQENNESNEKNTTQFKETNSTEVKKNSAKIENKTELPKQQITLEEKTKEKAKSTEKPSLFTLNTLDGKTIHVDETQGGLLFKEYENKVVLLLFFGHRCPPCLAEIPVLKALTNKGHKDLEIIAIEVQGLSTEQLKGFQKRKGINYTLVTYDKSADFVRYISKQAQWSGAIPFLIGFDKKSVVKVVHAGGLRAKDFDNIYNTLAKEK